MSLQKTEGDIFCLRGEADEAQNSHPTTVCPYRLRLRGETLCYLGEGKLYPGDGLVVIGEAGLAGTGILLERTRERLSGRFSERFLNRAADQVRTRSIPPALIQKYKKEASALMQMGRGGFLRAAWLLSEASETGFGADLRKVPVLQETIEICEVFDLDPYKLWSAGAYLAGAADAYKLVEEIHSEGYEAVVIGSVRPGPGRILKSGDISRFLSRPEPDELERFLGEGFDLE